MKKTVLMFPSKASMAEFILAHKIVCIDTDVVYFTCTGEFTDELLNIALKEYQAKITDGPDFISPY